MDAVRFLKDRARQLGVGENCLISMKAKDAEVRRVYVRSIWG